MATKAGLPGPKTYREPAITSIANKDIDLLFRFVMPFLFSKLNKTFPYYASISYPSYFMQLGHSLFSRIFKYVSQICERKVASILDFESKTKTGFSLNLRTFEFRPNLVMSNPK